MRGWSRPIWEVLSESTPLAPAAEKNPMLTVRSIHTYYGNIHALKGVSLHVGTGEVVTLIGANGAGKSTLVNTICGLVKPQKGLIELQGQAIQAMAPEKIVR